MSMLDWAKQEIEIACKHERDGSESEGFDYGVACYKSALKAFESLMGDGHSGMSIGFTKHILMRLIDGKPLLAIEGNDEEWSNISDYSGLKGEEVNYQNKRMSSLFKYVYADGTVKYRDVDRYVCIDINDGSSYTTFTVEKIVNELFPIAMPYYPANKIKVYCEDFLTDVKNGDYDTTGVFYLLDAKNERVEINRFYKESENGFVEISVEEYNERKSIKL